MQKDELILISVDDHIIEPPDMFAGRLPAKYADDAPRLVHRDDGTDAWKFRDTVIPNSALNAVAGRPKEEYGLEPQGLDEIRPGCYDVHERVKDMSAGGILGSMNFPSFPGFAGRLFATEDPEFSVSLVRAYNDCTSTSGAAPTRAGSSRWRCHRRRPARLSDRPRRLRPVPQPPHPQARGEAGGLPVPRPRRHVRHHPHPLTPRTRGQQPLPSPAGPALSIMM
jgi:hypothetical protein